MAPALRPSCKLILPCPAYLDFAMASSSSSQALLLPVNARGRLEPAAEDGQPVGAGEPVEERLKRKTPGLCDGHGGQGGAGTAGEERDGLFSPSIENLAPVVARHAFDDPDGDMFSEAEPVQEALQEALAAPPADTAAAGGAPPEEATDGAAPEEAAAGVGGGAGSLAVFLARLDIPGAAASADVYSEKWAADKAVWSLLDKAVHGAPAAEAKTIRGEHERLLKIVEDNTHDWSDTMKSLGSAALYMYKKRLADMSERDSVHLLFVVCGDRLIRAHDGATWNYDMTYGFWYTFSEIMPQDIFAYIQDWVWL